jgi:hypothetical protein
MAIKVPNKRFKKFRKITRQRWHRLQRSMQRRWVRLLIFPPLFITALVLAGIAVNPILFPPVKEYNFGVSFSKKAAEEYGVDWKANYLALLDDLKIRHYRLMSYWDVHEPERGIFDFTDLDWQMDEAAKRGAKVSLALGLRQPRWPECHEPYWAKQMGGHAWKQALYAYIEIVVERYEHHPALASWQLENEAFNAGFGKCPPPDRERVYEEFDLVKKISRKPLLMSLSDQHGIPFRGPIPDGFGYSVYRFVYNDKGPSPGYIWYPTPLWYHHLRTAIIRVLWGRPFFIHELQLEPWGPDSTHKLSIEEQNRTMSVDQIHRNVNFARQIGFIDIYTWGAEWWYWRKTVHGDYTIWETIRREIELSKQYEQ